jgi:hypothetical protein
MKAVLILTIASTLAMAQSWRGNEQSIRAQIRGGGGDSGKCTAEVVVDGVAEVAIRGEEGRIRTLSGQPATWRRLECNSVFPRNVSEFKFSGIDGRGRQELVQDPRSNNGMAVVRIEDPKGGSEGYTFDIEWRGGSGGNWGGGSGWGGNGAGSGWGGNSGGGGWGNSNSGGWGAGNNGGWNNSWGNSFSYRGRGSGQFSHSNGQQQALRGAEVLIDRATGRVEVRLDSDRGNRALQFVGRATQLNGNTVTANIESGENQGQSAPITGTMNIAIRSDRRVQNINMNGRVAGGRFTVDYRE